jgi:hypothetical protein
MKFRLLALAIGSGMMFAAIAADRQSDDMRRAIAWEHFKDVAAARQAAKERVHPSVSYGEANREDQHAVTSGTAVRDPGSRDYRVIKKNDELKKLDK